MTWAWALDVGVVGDGDVAVGAAKIPDRTRAAGTSSPLRPDLGAGVELRLSPANRSTLARALGGSARELRSSAFEGEEFSEVQFRPALQGGPRVLPRARIETFGKSGLAYGFRVENLYFDDRATGRAFFLAAAIYAEGGGAVGDGVYDYDSVSRPFLAGLEELAALRLFLP